MEYKRADSHSAGQVTEEVLESAKATQNAAGGGRESASGGAENRVKS